MFKKLLFNCFFVILFYCYIVNGAWANNIYGIHILETIELKKAAELVNSNGGDWGYVTIVLRDDDLKHDKWQAFFNECREKHLIPIVRIATHMINGGVWAKPKLDDLEKWPNFLSSLNWPSKQQIVVVFNEPNHAKEWGGEINPQEYVQVLDKMISLFNQKNTNFVVLNAGFDQAADGRNGTLREEDFLQHMFEARNNIFSRLDGWCSHSYPNHGFIGLPTDTGKATIKGYEWELEQLKRFSVTKDLPVYITETGWPHREGVSINNGFYDHERVAELLKESFNLWEQDSRVLAVTPFVLNYSSPPFDNFSWLNSRGESYKQFEEVQSLAKESFQAEQMEAFEVTDIKLGDILPTNHTYGIGQVKIKNTGQWIMGERGDFVLKIQQEEPQLKISSIRLAKGNLVKPEEEAVLDFVVQTGTQSAEHNLNFANKEYTIYVFKPFDLKNKKVNIFQQIAATVSIWWQEIKEK